MGFSFFFFSNDDFPSDIFSDFFRTALFSEKLLLHTSLTTSTFDTTVTLSEHLFLQRSCFFLRSSVLERVVSSQQLFFWIPNFLGTKLLLSSHFVRIESSLGKLLFGAATFLEYLLGIKISTEELLWLKQVLLHSISFFRRTTWATFLERPLFQKTFYSSNLFRRATFSQHTFSEELLFHTYASFPQLHLLFISW